MRAMPLLITMTLALSACGEARETPQEFMARAGAGLRGEVAALPRLPQHEPVTYSAAKLRDPFDPGAPAGPAPAPRAPRHPDPLEAYSLETLLMVGTLRAEGGVVALVRSPEGKVHQVRAGEHMGRNAGRVTRIGELEIELAEPLAGGETRVAKLPLAGAGLAAR